MDAPLAKEEDGFFAEDIEKQVSLLMTDDEGQGSRKSSGTRSQRQALDTLQLEQMDETFGWKYSTGEQLFLMKRRSAGIASNQIETVRQQRERSGTGVFIPKHNYVSKTTLLQGSIGSVGGQQLQAGKIRRRVLKPRYEEFRIGVAE